MAATLTDALDRLAHEGFTEHFGVQGNRLRSFESDRSFGTTDVVIRKFYRFEGVSDPDDMSIVYAIESASGVRGTLIDAFGVYADPTVSAFVTDVAIRVPHQRGRDRAA